MKRLNPKNFVPPIGPYSYATVTEDKIYTSGILPLDCDGNMPEGIENQTRQVLDNLKELLKANGCNFDFVIKNTVYLKNMDDFDVFNRVYGEYFTENYPSRTCVEVSRLPKDALIEIESFAKISFYEKLRV